MGKKVLTVFVIFWATILWAQGQNSFLDGSYDFFMMVDGNVLRIRDSNQLQLIDSSTIDDGTVVDTDGSYSNKSQGRFQLLEGECLDNDGIKYQNEYQYRRKIEQENMEFDERQIQAKKRKRYHLTFIKGQTYKIINYEQYFIQVQVDLGYGKVLQPNGIHRTSYGRSRLKEGGCISIKGKPLINAYEHRKVIIKKEIKARKKLI